MQPSMIAPLLDKSVEKGLHLSVIIRTFVFSTSQHDMNKHVGYVLNFALCNWSLKITWWDKLPVVRGSIIDIFQRYCWSKSRLIGVHMKKIDPSSYGTTKSDVFSLCLIMILLHTRLMCVNSIIEYVACFTLIDIKWRDCIPNNFICKEWTS